MSMREDLAQWPIFDSHFHIIDRRYPLIRNDGYLPDAFSCADYLRRWRHLRLTGGAVVSGSFQGFDRAHLRAALLELGPGFVGVAELPASTPDEEILSLDAAGVRAVRFNLRRGASEGLTHLKSMATRVHELAGWHVELYVDSRELSALYETLTSLPAVSIDHLGLSKGGLRVLLKLVERGVRVKASGFGRVDFAVRDALRDIDSANPHALMFGTDLPCTRAPRPYLDDDLLLIVDSLGEARARAVLCGNAIDFYRPRQSG
jgi:predicted TIM-barrel fold metal-dependent hydrolase